MSFENSVMPTTTANKDIKLNLNQSTIDLLNAAIASHSQTQLQQVQGQLLLSSGIHQQHQQLQQIHQLQQLQKLQLQLQQLQQQDQKDDDKNTPPPEATAAQGKTKMK